MTRSFEAGDVPSSFPRYPPDDYRDFPTAVKVESADRTVEPFGCESLVGRCDPDLVVHVVDPTAIIEYIKRVGGIGLVESVVIRKQCFSGGFRKAVVTIVDRFIQDGECVFGERRESPLLVHTRVLTRRL